MMSFSKMQGDDRYVGGAPAHRNRAQIDIRNPHSPDDALILARRAAIQI
jgi:hypothetical protein